MTLVLHKLRRCAWWGPKVESACRIALSPRVSSRNAIRAAFGRQAGLYQPGPQDVNVAKQPHLVSADAAGIAGCWRIHSVQPDLRGPSAVVRQAQQPVSTIA